MSTTNDLRITISGTVAPPVEPYTKLILIRSENPKTERFATTDPIPLGTFQTSALHWASILQAKVNFTLEADSESPDEPARDSKGYMHLITFQAARDLNTAQLVAVQAHTPREMDELNGLMEFRILTPIPTTLSNYNGELIDALEIIQWKDGSITSFEYQRGPNGILTPKRMLPPLNDLEKLTLDQGHQNGDPSSNHMRDLNHWTTFTDQATLARALNTVMGQNIPQERRDRDARMYAILKPAAAAAAAARHQITETIVGNILNNTPQT